jgi:RND family efflux transporter MFP subunit
MNKMIIMMSVCMSLCCCHDKKESAKTIVPDIDVATPIVRDVTLTRFYPGYLLAINSVELMARVSGTLLSTDYVSGSMVKKGKRLFVLESTTYRNSVEEAEAQLKTAVAQLEYAQSNYSRLSEALLSDAVSRIEVIQAEANVKEAEANVNEAEAQLSTARTNLGYCTITAPFDGMMSLSEFNVGSYIDGAASPVKMATIYDNSRMYAYFNIAGNQWLAMLLANPELHVDVLPNEVIVEPGDGGKPYKANLNYTSPDIDISTGTITLRADLDNSDGLLKSGQYVGIKLPYLERRDALLVNASSIATDQLGNYLYVVNNSNVVGYRHIEVGQVVDDTLRIVTGGLLPGDRYVTKALLKVRDGMTVNPISERTD